MRQWIGIDVGGTTIKGAAVLDDGTIVCKDERPTDADRGVDHMLDTMAELVKAMAEQAKWSLEQVSGVGVGVPAFLDFETGVVDKAVNLHWSNVPLRDELHKRLPGATIAIENDANAAALGEVWVGGGKGFHDALCITLGTGVGGGVIVDNKIVHGSKGMGGEVGHITIDLHGRLCNCGRHGCLETISSATGIVAMAKERTANGEPTSLSGVPDFDTQVIFEHASKGDRVAQEVVQTAIDTLGFALANICVTLNPQVIVVGGGVSKAGDALLLPLREAFARYAVPRVTEGTAIRLAELGNDAGVIGAALLQYCE